MDKQIFGPLELPSGKKISFREPVGADRVNVIQILRMGVDDVASGALLIDHYVASKCITDINGKTPDDNFKKRLDDMGDEDVQFYVAVFQELFGMTDEKRKKAKEAAAFLRKGQTSTASSN